MIDIIRIPDSIEIFCDEKEHNALVETKIEDRKIHFYLNANGSRPKLVKARWNYTTKEEVKILGDAWERAYGDLQWHGLSGERFLPWYFIVNNGKEILACGSMVRPNSFISFQYDAKGVIAWFDVRNGGKGVKLGTRELLIGTLVSKSYKNINEFEAIKDFCKIMCPNPKLPKMPVYGSNNWYYAYGNSSREDILRTLNATKMYCKDCRDKIEAFINEV